MPNFEIEILDYDDDIWYDKVKHLVEINDNILAVFVINSSMQMEGIYILPKMLALMNQQLRNKITL